MNFKLQLVRDGKTILEVPLSPLDWPKDQLATEFKAFEEDFQKFSNMFDALSNQTRLKMMRRLVEEEDRTMSFGGFMKDLDLNPKLVWENARKLREEGLLRKTGRGRYRCSEFGQRTFMMMSLALRHLQETLRELEEF